MLVLSALGHLVGAAVSGAFAAYALLWNRIPASYKRRLFVTAALALASTAAVIAVTAPSSWRASRFLHLTATTPFLVFGAKYYIPCLILMGFWALAVFPGGWPGRTPPATRSIRPDLAALAGAALAALPTSLQWPGTLHPLHFIDWRLALWFTLLLHASLAHRLPNRLTAWVCSACAATYFTFLMYDWRALGQLEGVLHRSVRAVPPRSRVVTDVTTLPLGINPVNHMIDRACIGHCFSYANYEPSTAQFRLRALPQSPAVLDSPDLVVSFVQGHFVVREVDLPLYGLFLQRATSYSFRARPLKAGERLRRSIVKLPPDWF